MHALGCLVRGFAAQLWRCKEANHVVLLGGIFHSDRRPLRLNDRRDEVLLVVLLLLLLLLLLLPRLMLLLLLVLCLLLLLLL